MVLFRWTPEKKVFIISYVMCFVIKYVKLAIKEVSAAKSR
jgi:hypothetical protein